MNGQTDITTISGVLAGIANGITGDANFDGFSNVFEYVPELSEITGSPVLTIRPFSLTSQISTNCEDQRLHTFRCEVYTLIDDRSTRAEVDAQAKTAANYLIHEIARNWDQSNGDFSQVSFASFGVNRGDFLVTEIDVVFDLLINVQ